MLLMNTFEERICSQIQTHNSGQSAVGKTTLQYVLHSDQRCVYILTKTVCGKCRNFLTILVKYYVLYHLDTSILYTSLCHTSQQ